MANAAGSAVEAAANSDALKIVAVGGIVVGSGAACVIAPSPQTCGAAMGAAGGLVGGVLGGSNLNGILVATAGGAALGAATGGLGLFTGMAANGAGAAGINAAQQFANTGSVDLSQVAGAGAFGAAGGATSWIISRQIAQIRPTVYGFDKYAPAAFGSFVTGLAGTSLMTDLDKRFPRRAKN